MLLKLLNPWNKGAIYGVVIILASYAITAFVFGNIGASIGISPTN